MKRILNCEIMFDNQRIFANLKLRFTFQLSYVVYLPNAAKCKCFVDLYHFLFTFKMLRFGNT